MQLLLLLFNLLSLAKFDPLKGFINAFFGDILVLIDRPKELSFSIDFDKELPLKTDLNKPFTSFDLGVYFRSFSCKSENYYKL